MSRITLDGNSKAVDTLCVVESWVDCGIEVTSFQFGLKESLQIVRDGTVHSKLTSILIYGQRSSDV